MLRIDYTAIFHRIMTGALPEFDKNPWHDCTLTIRLNNQNKNLAIQSGETRVILRQQSEFSGRQLSLMSRLFHLGGCCRLHSTVAVTKQKHSNRQRPNNIATNISATPEENARSDPIGADTRITVEHMRG
jgi:hypothetical protein